MCEAGRDEPFDELSAWIFSPTLTQHSHLMSTQRGFFVPGEPGTPQLQGKSERRGNPEIVLNELLDSAHVPEQRR